MTDFNQLHIQKASEEGRELLRGNDGLREAVRVFAAAPEPEKARIPGARLLGAGKFSFTFLIERTAVKVSSPTSSQAAFETKRPTAPENLERQYEVMSALRHHLDRGGDTITAPAHFFVAHTPEDVYILAQEYMDGWESVEGRTLEKYGSFSTDDETVKAELRVWTDIMRGRLTRALGGFGLRTSINDLGLDRPHGIHGGNILVPSTVELEGGMPLCIIDQPKNTK